MRYCLLVFFLAMTGLSHAQPDAASFSLTAGPWEQANKIFTSAAHWLGADGAASIDLRNGRVLWLFSDTFISRDSLRDRQNSKLIHNSVAIQNGYDPGAAKIRFYYKTGDDQQPAPFFHVSPEYWLWPGHGALVGGRLVLFFMKVREAANTLGFEVFGW